MKNPTKIPQKTPKLVFCLSSIRRKEPLSTLAHVCLFLLLILLDVRGLSSHFPSLRLKMFQIIHTHFKSDHFLKISKSEDLHPYFK